MTSPSSARPVAIKTQVMSVLTLDLNGFANLLESSSMRETISFLDAFYGQLDIIKPKKNQTHSIALLLQFL